MFDQLRLSKQIGFEVNWIVGFDQAFEMSDHLDITTWIADNCSSHAISHDRGGSLGPSGVVMFEKYDDAMMCWLTFRK